MTRIVRRSLIGAVAGALASLVVLPTLRYPVPLFFLAIVVGCSFSLSMPPQFPDYVSITAGGAMVPKDTSHMNGWDFGPGDMSIQFYGDWCKNLQSASISDLQAIFGCGPIS